MLNLKEQIEKDVKNRLAVARARLENEKNRLNLFKAERNTVACQLNQEASRGIKVCDIQCFNTYLDHLNNKVAKQANIVNMHSKTADKIREELVKAMQEKKTLQKLKEKKYIKFKKEVNRKEQMAVDELISYRLGKTAGEA